jgi:hypothetical protein
MKSIKIAILLLSLSCLSTNMHAIKNTPAEAISPAYKSYELQLLDDEISPEEYLEDLTTRTHYPWRTLTSKIKEIIDNEGDRYNHLINNITNLANKFRLLTRNSSNTTRFTNEIINLIKRT